MKTRTITTIISAFALFAFAYARPPMMRPMHHHHHTPPPPMHHLHKIHLPHPPLFAPVAIGPTIGRVWVPPVYETRPVYDRFGNIIRYEQVLVSAGYWRF